MAYRDIILADSPVAYLRLGEPTGTTADDSSVNGLDGTYQGTLDRAITGALVGDPDGATGISGTNAANRVDLPSGAIVGTGAEFSIETWVKFTTTVINAAFYSERQLALAASVVALFQSTTPSAGRIQLFYRNNASATRQVISPTAINDGQWHHVVAVKDATLLRLYVDGTEVATGALLAGAITLDAPTVFASRTTTNTNPATNGTGVDEVAVYNYALSPAQIAAHYAAAFGTTIHQGAATIAALSDIVAGALIERNGVANIAALSNTIANALAERNGIANLAALSNTTIDAFVEHHGAATIAALSDALADANVTTPRIRRGVYSGRSGIRGSRVLGRIK